jgi:hypothetical protein
MTTTKKPGANEPPGLLDIFAPPTTTTLEQPQQQETNDQGMTARDQTI